LAAALAVEASRKGRDVALVDADPQQSLARWYQLRVEAEDDEPLLLIEADKPIEPKSEKIWVIIDTPAALLPKIEDAINLANLVVIPARASAMDVDGILPVVALCNRLAKPFVFVLTQTFADKTMNEGARAFLSAHGEVLEQEIESRPSHSRAMLSGLTAAEYEPRGAVAKEIAALWSDIEELATGKRKHNKAAARKAAS
jgi:chromosome partitioning protein